MAVPETSYATTAVGVHILKDPGSIRAFARYSICATPGSVVVIERALREVDACAVLPTIPAPTLAMHQVSPRS